MPVHASITPAPITGEPGGRASGLLHLSNPGQHPVSVRVGVAGDVAAIVSVDPPRLELGPGEETTATLLVRLPRSPQPPAGELSFAVEIGPEGDEPITVHGAVQVAPFTDLFATITPRTSTGTRAAAHVLTVENRGNVAVRAAVSVGQGGEALDIEIAPEQLDAEPGGWAKAVVTVRPRARTQGPSLRHDFVLVARAGQVSATARATMQQQRRRRVPLPIAAGVIAVVVLATVAGASRLSRHSRSRPAAETTQTCVAEGHLQPRRRSPAPAASGGASPASGASPSPAALPANYSFLQVRSDGCTPVRFNPCEAIHYLVNASMAPPQGVADLQEAFRRLGEATGSDFVFEGTTDEGTGRTDRDLYRRRPHQPERYGERWAPVLVFWAHMGGPGRDDVVVLGRSLPATVRGVIVTGVLGLNLDAVTNAQTGQSLPDGFGPGITWGRVMLHELGHLAGLGHVSGRRQLMYQEHSEQTAFATDYGIGDRAGLRLLGRKAGCVASPPLTAAPDEPALPPGFVPPSQPAAPSPPGG